MNFALSLAGGYAPVADPVRWSVPVQPFTPVQPRPYIEAPTATLAGSTPWASIDCTAECML